MSIFKTHAINDTMLLLNWMQIFQEFPFILFCAVLEKLFLYWLLLASLLFSGANYEIGFKSLSILSNQQISLNATRCTKAIGII
jgi:hypothetical protein